jgi:hypothetical protein
MLALRQLTTCEDDLCNGRDVVSVDVLLLDPDGFMQRANTTCSYLTPGGLCKTLLEEVQADSGPKRGQEGLQWPSVISEENPPCFQVGDGSLDGRAQRADLVIVVVFAHVKLTVFRFAYRGDDVIGSNESFVADHTAGQQVRQISVQ